MEPAASLDARVLAKLMLMQSMVGQLPSGESICSFICRGLEDLPGVAGVRCGTPGVGAERSGSKERQRVFPLRVGDQLHGQLEVRLADPQAFEAYAQHVHNLAFMAAVVIEERRQRLEQETLQRDLESRVEERTRELQREVAVRQAAEAAALAERERLAVTLRSIGDGVISTDRALCVTMMNVVAEMLTGWTEAEALGRPLAEVFAIFAEDTGEVRPDPAGAAMAQNRVVELANHTVLRARDGIERPVADSGAPIRDGSGSVLGAVLVFRDMTEKHRLQARLQRVDKLEALGVLAGGIAHDFNNMLGGIFGYVDLARLSCEKDSDMAGLLEQALSVAPRARDLTRQLLTFAKGGEPKRTTGEIEPLVRESVIFALAGASLACTFELPEDLWPCDFDGNQIGQVLDNLVINAREAMPAGGRLVVRAENLEVPSTGRVAAPQRMVRIAVCDSGPGITREQQARIFDPFYSTKPGGSGLGLATCHSIMERHDGAIEVRSQPGEGATFFLLLPASHQPVQVAEPKEGAVHRGAGCFLVLDDEAMVRKVAQSMLACLGYETLAAQHGAEALDQVGVALAEGRPLRGALLDLTVPGGLGGQEIAAQLRALAPSMVLIATSGYADGPVMSRPEAFGFAASLAKPYCMNELSDVLAKVLAPIDVALPSE